MPDVAVACRRPAPSCPCYRAGCENLLFHFKRRLARTCGRRGPYPAVLGPAGAGLTEIER
jgi:hypothetical protein